MRLSLGFFPRTSYSGCYHRYMIVEPGTPGSVDFYRHACANQHCSDPDHGGKVNAIGNVDRSGHWRPEQDDLLCTGCSQAVGWGMQP